MIAIIYVLGSTNIDTKRNYSRYNNNCDVVYSYGHLCWCYCCQRYTSSYLICFQSFVGSPINLLNSIKKMQPAMWMTLLMDRWHFWTVGVINAYMAYTTHLKLLNWYPYLDRSSMLDALQRLFHQR